MSRPVSDAPKGATTESGEPSAAFTPGPWVRHNGELLGSNGKRVVLGRAQFSLRLASPSQEEIANAVLAEAAPVLLEAAREACDFISAHFENLTTGEIEGDAGEPLSMLYSAINKALGGQP